MSIFCLHPADVLGRLKLGSCHMPCVMTEAAIGQVTDISGTNGQGNNGSNQHPKWEAFTKQKRWPRVPTGPAPKCVT